MTHSTNLRGQVCPHCRRRLTSPTPLWADWYTRPEIPDSRVLLPRVRFFARLRAFDLACPRCGMVWSPTRGRRLARCFDPISHVFTCHKGSGGCGLRLQLGVLAYPVQVPRSMPGHQEASRGDPRVRLAPEDTQPTLEEARAMAGQPGPLQRIVDAGQTGEAVVIGVFKRTWASLGAVLHGRLVEEKPRRGGRVNRVYEGRGQDGGEDKDEGQTQDHQDYEDHQDYQD